MYLTVLANEINTSKKELIVLLAIVVAVLVYLSGGFIWGQITQATRNYPAIRPAYTWGPNLGWASWLNSNEPNPPTLFLVGLESIDSPQGNCHYVFYGKAWLPNAGWINFGVGELEDRVQVCEPMPGGGTDKAVRGHAWGPNVGWISFDPEGRDPVVFRQGSMLLFGDAWSPERGWISMNNQVYGSIPPFYKVQFTRWGDPVWGRDHTPPDGNGTIIADCGDGKPDESCDRLYIDNQGGVKTIWMNYSTPEDQVRLKVNLNSHDAESFLAEHDVAICKQELDCGYSKYDTYHEMILFNRPHGQDQWDGTRYTSGGSQSYFQLLEAPLTEPSYTQKIGGNYFGYSRSYIKGGTDASVVSQIFKVGYMFGDTAGNYLNDNNAYVPLQSILGYDVEAPNITIKAPNPNQEEDYPVWPVGTKIKWEMDDDSAVQGLGALSGVEKTYVGIYRLAGATLWNVDGTHCPDDAIMQCTSYPAPQNEVMWDNSDGDKWPAGEYGIIVMPVDHVGNYSDDMGDISTRVTLDRTLDTAFAICDHDAFDNPTDCEAVGPVLNRKRVLHNNVDFLFNLEKLPDLTCLTNPEPHGLCPPEGIADETGDFKVSITRITEGDLQSEGMGEFKLKGGKNEMVKWSDSAIMGSYYSLGNNATGGMIRFKARFTGHAYGSGGGLWEEVPFEEFIVEIPAPWLAVGAGDLYSGFLDDLEETGSGAFGVSEGLNAPAESYNGLFYITAKGSIYNYSSAAADLAAGISGVNQDTVVGATAKIDLAALSEGAAPITMDHLSGPIDFSDNAVKVRSGDLRLGSATFLNSGTIIVKDDLTIDGDISYAENDFSATEEIPSVGIIVEGNITVRPNVTRIVGTYLAYDQDPMTLARTFTVEEGESENTRLTIQGAVIAEAFTLGRTGVYQSGSYALITEGANIKEYDWVPEDGKYLLAKTYGAAQIGTPVAGFDRDGGGDGARHQYALFQGGNICGIEGGSELPGYVLRRRAATGYSCNPDLMQGNWLDYPGDACGSGGHMTFDPLDEDDEKDDTVFTCRGNDATQHRMSWTQDSDSLACADPETCLFGTHNFAFAVSPSTVHTTYISHLNQETGEQEALNLEVYWYKDNDSSRIWRKVRIGGSEDEWVGASQRIGEIIPELDGSGVVNTVKGYVEKVDNEDTEREVLWVRYTAGGWRKFYRDQGSASWVEGDLLSDLGINLPSDDSFKTVFPYKRYAPALDVIYDGRVIVNPPPGFSKVSLPTWQQTLPLDLPPE